VNDPDSRELKQGKLLVMRCQFCGNVIGVYRKMTDTDFCSADHRQKHEHEQQQILLDRLKSAGVRVQLSRDRFIARRTAAAAPADPGPAPFLLPSPGPVAGAVQVAACSALPVLSPDVHIPESVWIRKVGAPAGGFQPNLPWPCQHSELRSFGDVGAGTGPACGGTEHLEATARVFAAWNPVGAAAAA
jgi:hypothetical protein